MILRAPLRPVAFSPLFSPESRPRKGGLFAAYALALDFKNGVYKSSTGLASLSALPGYTYTRSGAKSEIASAGTIYPFAADVPGIVPGDGYWSRASLTNLVKYSDDLANANWLKGNVSVTSNALTTTNGLSLDRVEENTTVSGEHFVVPESVGAANHVAGLATVSFLFKADQRTLIRLAYFAFNNLSVVLNPPAGTYTVVAGGVAPVVSFKALGEGVYRCSVTDTASAATARPTLTLVSTGTTTIYPGSVGAGAYLGHVQAVAGTQPGPIIVTEGATATVGADNLGASCALADEDFLVLAIGTVKQIGAQGDLADFNNGSTDRVVLFVTSGGEARLYALTGGSGTSYASAVNFVAGDRIAIAGFRRSGGFGFAVKKNSSAPVLVAPAAKAMPSVVSLKVGASQTGSAEHFNNPIEFVGVRRGTFSDADITAILAAA